MTSFAETTDSPSCRLTYVELAPSFNGDVAEQDELLADFGISVDFGENRDKILLAHKAWYEHVLRKRNGEATKRPIADVMIGAYALQKGGLITRNEEDFRHRVKRESGVTYGLG